MLSVALKRRQGDFSVDATFSTRARVTALFGPSGSGKTTLLMMMAGLLQPEAGHIRIDDQFLYDSATGVNLPPEQRRLGVVFQDGRLFPHLSVRKNLLFAYDLLPESERRIALDAVIEVLGIVPLLERMPGRLSGGEKQRVAIGRALLGSPQMLLMDEPLAALDQKRKAELLPFLAQLTRSFTIPVVYVSHSVNEVLHLADDLVLLEQGRVVVADSVERVLSRPDLVSLTGGSQAGSVLRGQIAGYDPASGLTRLALGSGQLVLAGCYGAIGRDIRIRCHARDIAISLHPPAGTSLRNILPVHIHSVQPARTAGCMDLLLDWNGVTLWSQITIAAFQELNIQPGQQVQALVKSLSIADEDIVGPV